MYKITPDMIEDVNEGFIHLRVRIRESCSVCKKNLFSAKYTTLLVKDALKIDDNYYLVHMKGGCRELFLLTPQLYIGE